MVISSNSRRDTLSQLLRVEPFHRPQLAAVFALSAITGLGYDLPRYGFSELYVVTELAATLAQALAYFAILWPLRNRIPQSFLPIASGVVFVASYLGKVSLSAFVLGPDDWAAELATRLPGDASYAALVWFGISIASVSLQTYRLELARLSVQRSQLDSQTAAHQEIVSDLNDELRRQSREALTPSLNALKREFSSRGPHSALDTIAQDINRIIEDRLKPLSSDITNQVFQLENYAKDTRVVQEPTLAHKIKVSPARDLRVTAAFLAVSVNVFFTIAQLGNYQVAALVFLVSVSYWALCSVAVTVVPRGLSLGIPGLLAFVTALSSVGYLPTLAVFQLLVDDYPALVPIQFTVWGVFTIGVFIVTVWASLQRARAVQLQELDAVTRQIKRQLALSHQGVWLIQRKWSYLLHGTVQATLTVARARLQTAPSITAAVRKAVLADINRAKKALEQPVKFSVDARELLEEIRTTWAGLCEVHTDIPEDVFDRIAGVELTTTSVIEIIKELVNNAYRHGGASDVWITCRLDDHGDLLVTSGNNGSPFPTDIHPGIGFQMFTELATSWSIDSENNRFTATIAASTPKESEEV